MKDLALGFPKLDICLVNLFIIALKRASRNFFGIMVALFVLNDRILWLVEFAPFLIVIFDYFEVGSAYGLRVDILPGYLRLQSDRFDCLDRVHLRHLWLDH